VLNSSYDYDYEARIRRLRFSFFMRLRCHFQRICRFFFQRRELLFIALLSMWVAYKGFVGLWRVENARHCLGDLSSSKGCANSISQQMFCIPTRGRRSDAERE
jgi:hypothetical protein